VSFADDMMLIAGCMECNGLDAFYVGVPYYV